MNRSMEKLTRVPLVMAIAGLLLAVLASAASDKPEKAVDPTFRPGGKVDLHLTLRAPEGWHLNYMVPLRVQFDPEQMKKLPLAVDKITWEYKLDKYQPQYELTIPVRVAKGAEDGTLRFTLSAAAGICDDPVTQCTFVNEDVPVELTVQAKAAKGAKGQALAKGALKTEHCFSPPE